MLQVLFYIPLSWLFSGLPDVPVYGYGMMLFLAFVGTQWLACRLAKRSGIDPDLIPDLTLWLFVSGIAGGRLAYVAQEWRYFRSVGDWWRIVAIWDGGLIFYGSIFGGLIGYLLYHRKVMAKQGVSHLKMFDVIAPCIALGLFFGRIGCLLTGCCFGNAACPDCPAISFPMGSAPTMTMVKKGYQSPTGFLVYGAPAAVVAVDPGSPADQAGLRVGDQIVAINKEEIGSERDYDAFVYFGGLKGQREMAMTVTRAGHSGRVELEPFVPGSIPLHPTQIYESISMALLLFFLLSYFPYKWKDGFVLVLLMAGYGVHRFLNEMLRIDNEKIFLDLTLSQNISLLVLIAACVLAFFVWRAKPPQAKAEEAPPPDDATVVAANVPPPATQAGDPV
jgi:phosphatidylglycerol:prolipoprotein diacylglycerol transferase